MIIDKAVKAMKSMKAPDADRITAEALKAGGDRMADIVLKICNAA